MRTHWECEQEHLEHQQCTQLKNNDSMLLRVFHQESLLSDGPQHQPFKRDIWADRNPMLLWLRFMFTGLYINTTALILSAFMCAGMKSRSSLTSSHCQCLLSRVRGVGGGTEAARRRRQHAGYQEVRWARERGALEVGRRQGRLVVRSGHFLLD